MEFMKKIKAFFKPYDKKMGFWKLAGRWFAYLIIGIVIMDILYSAYPPFSTEEQQVFADFCTPFNILYTIMFPFFEVIVFMILPYMWKGQKGLSIALVIWAVLHLLSSGIPIFIYISLMAVFYYKAISSKKYKDVLILIFLLNAFSVISCI